MPRPRTSLPAAVYVALSVADSVAAGGSSRTARGLRYALKPALMPALTLAFLGASRGHVGEDVRVLRGGTAAAQVLSWGGDVALLGRSERSFLAGLGSFFGAHTAYIAANLSARGKRAGRRPAGVGAALGLWLVTAPVMSTAAARKDPALRVPVAAYVGVLCAMFASAQVLDPALPRRARRNIQAGTALFLVSDCVLGVQQFVLDEPSPVLGTVVMSTYTAGQGLIATGVAQAVSEGAAG